ncbi:MAG: carbohydrate binding family 9 domain-containing protein [Gemmatimonadaceae bacterium]
MLLCGMLMLASLALLLQATPNGGTGRIYNGREQQLNIQVPRRDTAVVIDGTLDESVWQDAAVLTGFSQFQPQDGLPAADSSQVLVWYSPTAIHFGIRAYEPPDRVRATLANRDRIDQDDNIQILLGTFGDGRQATVFMVNPLGVQADGTLVEKSAVSGGFLAQITAREAPDLNPDFVFQSKGRLTAWGYEVEVRIPFKSLTYQSIEVQRWDLNVVRRVQYRGHENSWAPARKAGASFLSQGGHLEGLTDLHRGIVVDVTPELTQRTEGSSRDVSTLTGWRYDAKGPEIGGNIRLGVTNNLSLGGAINPDFSQVEADAGQISFDPRAAQSVPEKRPFFLDGVEHFTTPNTLIYTRSIVQPVAAVKLFWKASGNDVAVLSAVDAASASADGQHHPVFNILRLQRDVGPGSRLGVMYSDWVTGDNSNRVFDADGRFVWQKVYTLTWQAAGSSTTLAGVHTTAPLWDLHFLRNGRRLSWRSQFTGIDEDFRTKTGFIARAGQVHANINPVLSWYGKRGSLIDEFDFDVLADGIWAYQHFFHSGDARDKKLHFNVRTQLRGGWTAGVSFLAEMFGYDPAFYSKLYRIEVPRPGLPSDTLPFVGTQRLYNTDYVVSLGTPKLKFVSLNTVYIHGLDEDFSEWSSATLDYLSFTADVRPSQQLRIGATYLLIDHKRRSNGRRVDRVRDPRLKMEYQLSRNIFVRVIGEYRSAEVDALRDDSRTNYPLLVRDPESGLWVQSPAQMVNTLNGNFLFSYTPVPGTVFYAGYGSLLTEPDAFAFRTVRRQNDAFFLKASYLFRR